MLTTARKTRRLRGRQARINGKKIRIPLVMIAQWA